MVLGKPCDLSDSYLSTARTILQALIPHHYCISSTGCRSDSRSHKS